MNIVSVLPACGARLNARFVCCRMDVVEPTWRIKTAGYKVAAVPVGRADGPYKLRVNYRPSGQHGKAISIASNHPRYGKSWPTRETAEQPENKEAFLRWVETGLGQGAGGGHSTTDSSSIEALLGAAATRAVAEVVTNVVRRKVAPKHRGGRGGGGGGALVKPGGSPALSIRRPLFSRTNHKVREQKMKRRQAALAQAGEKAAANAEWLSRQIKHLAAVIDEDDAKGRDQASGPAHSQPFRLCEMDPHSAQ